LTAILALLRGTHSTARCSHEWGYKARSRSKSI